jgi:hypothetical protein
VIETAFRALIIAQPFLWMWMIEDPRWDALDDVDIEAWFGVAVFAFVVFVSIFNVSIGFYSAELLMVYAVLVWWGTYWCQREFLYSFKDALAISFLITYLNSWYWEGVLHVWAIQENGLNSNQLLQLLHLIPAVYFLKYWEFDVFESAQSLMKGWAFAGLITFARKARIWRFLPIVFTDANVYFFNHGLMILNRIICFVYLLDAIVRWGISNRE